MGRTFRALQGASDDRYEGAKSFAEMVVTGVEKDSAGGTLAARGTIDGAGEDTVPMRGVSSTQVGDRLLISYGKDDPAGPKTYVRHIASANPAPQIDVNPDLPDPQFASPPFISVLIASPGSITSSLTIKFQAVEDRFFPEGYTVSYKVAGGEWGEGGFVPHTGGLQESRLGNDFAPGTFVDVRLRAHYARNTLQSPGLDTRTFQTALDDVSPGAATALAGSVTSPGALVLTASGSVNDHFAGWFYEIAAANGGVTIASGVTTGPFTYAASPGSYYAKVTPISKSGVLGTPYPGTNHTGPFAIAAFAPPLDTTPPPDWTAPTLAQETNHPATGGEEYWLTITLPTSPAYAYPADYDYTIALVSGTGFAGQSPIPNGQPSTKVRVQAVGLISVTLIGVDKLGNKSSASPAATITINPTGVPGGTPILTTTSVGLAILTQWTAATDVVEYEVHRATSNTGTGDTIIGTTDALMWVDPLIDPNLVLPSYWYRVRGWNTKGFGNYSAWVQGTVGAPDGQNLKVNSVTANQIIGDQAFFNKVLTGNLVASVLKTAASGARWEMDNAGGGQIRLYSATQPVLLLDGSGLGLYRDATSWRAQFLAAGINFYQDTGASVLRSQFLGDGLRIKQDNGTDDRVKLLNTGLYVEAASGSTDDRMLMFETAGSIVLSNYWADWSKGGFFVRLERGDLICRLEAGGSQRHFNWHANSGTELGITPSTTGMGVNLGSAYLYAGGLLVAGNNATSGYANGGTLQNKGAAGLASASGSADYSREQWTLSNSGAGNKLSLLEFWVNRATNTAWGDAVLRHESRVDNTGAVGGHADIGMAGNAGYWALGRSGIQDLEWDQTNNRIHTPGNLRIDGAISKGSGTFDIAHPDPAKRDSHRLRHGFVEAPTRGDTIYRFAVYVRPDEIEREVVTDLPGYWPHLNEGGQCWVSPRRNFGRAWAEVAGDGRRFVLAADRPGWYNVLIVATRADEVARAGWDAIAGGAVEYGAKGAAA